MVSVFVDDVDDVDDVDVDVELDVDVDVHVDVDVFVVAVVVKSDFQRGLRSQRRCSKIKWVSSFVSFAHPCTHRSRRSLQLDGWFTGKRASALVPDSSVKCARPILCLQRCSTSCQGKWASQDCIRLPWRWHMPSVIRIALAMSCETWTISQLNQVRACCCY